MSINLAAVKWARYLCLSVGVLMTLVFHALVAPLSSTEAVACFLGFTALTGVAILASGLLIVDTEGQ